MTQIINEISHYFIVQLQDMGFWEIIQVVGLMLSFIYLLLEFEQKALMWVVSAMCSMIYASVYYRSKIYADMGFSIFNICMCVYGFYKWWTLSQKNIANKTHNTVSKNRSNITNKNKEKKEIVYYHFTLPQFGRVMTVFTLIWTGIFFILKYLTDSPIPALDALTTTINIVGTWVLAQKIIEVWGFWFMVNILSIYIYYKRGLHLSTILLYCFYLGASVYGYFKWKRHGILSHHR